MKREFTCNHFCETVALQNEVTKRRRVRARLSFSSCISLLREDCRAPSRMHLRAQERIVHDDDDGVKNG